MLTILLKLKSGNLTLKTYNKIQSNTYALMLALKFKKKCEILKKKAQSSPWNTLQSLQA